MIEKEPPPAYVIKKSITRCLHKADLKPTGQAVLWGGRFLFTGHAFASWVQLNGSMATRLSGTELHPGLLGVAQSRAPIPCKLWQEAPSRLGPELWENKLPSVAQITSTAVGDLRAGVMCYFWTRWLGRGLGERKNGVLS